jgi:hypothetical protein
MKYLSLLACVFITVSCKDYSPQGYRIIDRVGNERGDSLYVVYTPDTNWVEMETFANNLVQGKGKWSAVGFFNPEVKTLKLNPDHSIPKESSAYLVANYRFNEKEQKFLLYKSNRRFRKDMRFRPSPKLFN